MSLSWCFLSHRIILTYDTDTRHQAPQLLILVTLRNRVRQGIDITDDDDDDSLLILLWFFLNTFVI